MESINIDATKSRAMIGHNNPPSALDLAIAPFSGVIGEAENWADGANIDSDAQLAASDRLLKALKDAKKAVDAARDEETKPLHKAWQDAINAWKPTLSDLDRLIKCLVAAQAPYKAKLAAEKEAARLEAERIAAEKAEAARRAHAEANAASIEAQRAADEMMKEAERAERDAARAAKDTVKGMRTVQVYEIESHKAALHWIAVRDREAITAFIEDYVRRNFRTHKIDGVKVETRKEAF